MQGNNWQLLILLVVAVVIYALVQAHRKPTDDEDGEGTEAPEDGSAPDEHAVPGGNPPEPEAAEVPWTECQEQLSEAPPLSECDQVEFDEPDEAGTAHGDETEEEAARETEVEPVPPSKHSLGMAIRARAWRLFRENYRKILPLSGIVVLLMTIRLLIQKTGLFPHWLMGVAGPMNLLVALVAPVVTLGAAYAAVRLWDGEAPRPGMLFHFLKERRYFPALGLMLLNGLVLLLPSLVLPITFRLIHAIFFSGSSAIPISDMGVFLIYAATLLILCLRLWIAAWLQMAGFAYVRAPERGAMAAFRAGFRVGSRNSGSFVGMMIAAGWPFAALSVLGYLISIWEPVARSPLTSLVSSALFLLLVLFYGGYMLLSMAGLAARLYPEEAAPMESNEDAAANANDAGAEMDARD